MQLLSLTKAGGRENGGNDNKLYSLKAGRREDERNVTSMFSLTIIKCMLPAYLLVVTDLTHKTTNGDRSDK